MPAATPRPEFVSFLSDYGFADEFVGVCKSVILSIAPHLQIIDVSHNIPAHDVRSGALTLVRAAQYLPLGIILAVVDPGVGTDRRAIAVQTESCILIGPDNGILAPAVAILGGAVSAVSLTNPDYLLESAGPTFAGRDVFAPAAGFIASGVALGDLGESIDPASLTPGMLPIADTEGEEIRCEIWWIDSFGNAQLNIGPESLAERGLVVGDQIEVKIRDNAGMLRWVHTYADAKPSEFALVVDSYGLCSLVLDRRSAAAEHDLRIGTEVRISTPPASVVGVGARTVKEPLVTEVSITRPPGESE